MFALVLALTGCGAARHVPTEVTYVVVDRPTVPTTTVVYGGMVDPRLAQAVQYSAAYRATWTAANGGVPTGRPVTYGSAPATSAAPLDLSAKCPEDRDPATQAELDACQNNDISRVLDVVGTVEVK